MDDWINETLAGGAQPSITLNLFDWAAKNAVSSTLGSFPVNVYGPQQTVDPWNTNLGNGVRNNGSNITGNDPNIAYVPNSPAIEQAWIQHLINTFGNSQNGGVQYYTLGNEPGLWNHTHRDIHPNGNTLTELRDRVIAYASMVKSLDPNAEILGFEEWGWTNYFISGADSAAQNWGATYNGLNCQTWLLDQMRQHDDATGPAAARLLHAALLSRRAASSATTSPPTCSSCGTAPRAACGTRTTSMKAGSPAPASTAGG